jgi:integrase
MPKQRRFSTKYAGVYFVEGTAVGRNEPERIYYIRYRRNGQIIEEKVGRQFQHDMTPARAAGIRSQRIDGKALSNAEKRHADEERKMAEANRWPIQRLWDDYSSRKQGAKGMRADRCRYEKYLKERFGNLETTDIIQLDIDRLRINLLKNKSPQTVKHILALLSRIIHFGESRGLCRAPDFRIQLPKVDNRKTEDLTPEQLKNLLQAIDNSPNKQAGNLMKMALFTGMRRGELFKLRWEDVDSYRGFIFIRDPKAGVSQKIPLNDATRELLEKHPRGDSQYIFPGRHGKLRVDINHQVRAITTAAGLPKDFRPLHCPPHTYANRLACQRIFAPCMAYGIHMQACWHQQARWTCTPCKNFLPTRAR